jgi:hypothetical protein
MLRYLSCFYIIFFTALQAGEIRMTNDFSQIEESVNQLDVNALVLFDVDGTLIVPDDVILKPSAKYLFEQLIAGHPERDLFRDIRMKASHSLVDFRSLGLIQKLQKNGIPAIAFTAAPAKIRGVESPGDWRVDELKRYGFDFSWAFQKHGVIEFPKNKDQTHAPLFKSGVLFSSFHSKGEILITFLKKVGWIPKKVVFVDDEIEHVQSVISALEQQDIDCIGFQYTAAADAFAEDIDLAKARYQVDYFIKHDIWLE